jgi:hypothetical protein
LHAACAEVAANKVSQASGMWVSPAEVEQRLLAHEP